NSLSTIFFPYIIYSLNNNFFTCPNKFWIQGIEIVIVLYFYCFLFQYHSHIQLVIYDMGSYSRNFHPIFQGVLNSRFSAQKTGEQGWVYIINSVGEGKEHGFPDPILIV